MLSGSYTSPGPTAGVEGVVSEAPSSMRKCCQIIGRAKGSMCRTTSPSRKSRTVPEDWLTATAMAVVTLLMAAAAQ